MTIKWFTNISEEYKSFTWTPERTGSNNFTKIIEKLGFKATVIENNNVISYLDTVKHNHFCKLFNNHEDYKFIISVRNPYSMAISRTGIPNLGLNIDDSKKLTRDSIENMIQNPFDFRECCQCFHIRKPDYIIRLEHLYEDWLKIPFIQNHEIYLSGELKKLTSTRINSQRNTEEKDYWKKYYDKSTADLVYYSFSSIFELAGYDKDSWK